MVGTNGFLEVEVSQGGADDVVEHLVGVLALGTARGTNRRHDKARALRMLGMSVVCV